MEYTREQFIEDVKAEAMALREHATKDELNKLGIFILNPYSYYACVYGLMTGDCRSKRASQLIELCCPRFFVNDKIDVREIDVREKLISDVVPVAVNGAKLSHPVSSERNPASFQIDHLSSIETYIMFQEANRYDLLNYLRGETDTLDL